MLISRLFFLFKLVSSFFLTGKNFVYRFVIFFILPCFLYLRVPYIFGVEGFATFLFCLIAPLYLSSIFIRLSGGSVLLFIYSFVPEGTPLWISPFVSFIEVLSYLVRPIILMLRPLLNLSAGCLGGVALGGLFLKGGLWSFVFFSLLFFYEIFVACVHWFIVCEIVSFTEIH